MTSPSPSARSTFNALATYLEHRRAAILHAWQNMIEADPALSTASQLTLTDFMDGIPDWLNALNKTLRNLAISDEPLDPQAEAAVRDEAGAHGSHRWEQGYNLRELTHEWGHLHLCLGQEIELFRQIHPEFDAHLTYLARQALTQAMHAGINESVSQYVEMQKAEAASHVGDLEQALTEMSALERTRGEALRAASHDLRGGLTVVHTAAQILDQVPEQEDRTSILESVQRSVISLHQMLNDLTDLARLEAGQERVTINAFDAAAMLAELCITVEPVARNHNLQLQTKGPLALAVEGDEIKVRRIAQNLLLNALNYTERGGVQVSWAIHETEHWMLTIADSGPGLASAAAGVMESAQPDRRSGVRPGQQDRRSVVRHNEGIGLSIVKRLCELLDARLEVHTEKDVGTTFHITFPRSYKAR